MRLTCSGLLLVALSTQASLADPAVADAVGTEPHGPVAPHGGPLFRGHPADRIELQATPLLPGAPAAVPSVRFRWPLRMQDFWHPVNYVDLDPSAGILDWDCLAASYDGHQGHDTVIPDFVTMDEGRYVLAAEAGTVVTVFDGNFDRHTVWTSGVQPNYVGVQHADGTISWYLHMVKWSTMVHVGQQVREGQPLGLVGSSGFSDHAHLHFEVHNASTVYESFDGPCNPGDSLWKDQSDHTLDEPVALYDYGMQDTQPSYANLQEPPPDVLHLRQSIAGARMYFWYKLTSVHVGDTSRVIFRRPNGTVFFDSGFSAHGQSYPWSWWYWFIDLPTSGSAGTWTIEYQLNAVTQATTAFAYDATPNQPPIATARTVDVEHGVAREALVASGVSSDVSQMQLVTPPAQGWVRLYGPRQRYFQYTPVSGFAGTDTFTFRAVDGLGLNSIPATISLDVSATTANALRLEGEGDYVSVPASATLDLATGLTLEAWVRRVDGSAGWRGLIDRRHPTLGNNFGYYLFLSPDSKLRFGVGTGSAEVYTFGTTQIPLDRWVHVAGTWDGAMLRLYVDGVQEPSPTAFAGPISYSGVGALRLGGSFGTNESFRGEIEEARVWSVARSATELQQGAGCTFFENPVPASVKAWWRLQGTAVDSSANGNNGTLLASASFSRTDPGIPLDCLVQDLDADGLADGPDNCPLDANTLQEDADGDGVGDRCDLCPVQFQRAQVDSDGDGVGDICDGCPFLGDTRQLDGDGDGSGDLCDPAPASALSGVPSDAITLVLDHDAGETAVSWNAAPFAATYEVIRGTLAEIRDRFYGTCRSADDPNLADTLFLDGESPAPGELFGYLIRGVAADGTQGLAGSESNSTKRDLRAKDCVGVGR